MANHVHAWKQLSSISTKQLDWVANGVQIPFDNTPPETYLSNKSFSPKQSKFINSEIESLIQSGAISETVNRPKFVSPIGCVPKRNNKHRLIVDLRELNSYCSPPSFKYEGIDTVCSLMKPGDVFCTFDLQNGFQHVNVHRDSREYLGIQWKNRYFILNVLPFGLGLSPFYFCKTLRPVVAELRLKGLRIVIYVDDILLMAQPCQIQEHKHILLQILDELGLYVNWEKSSLVPKTKVQYLGYVLISQGDDGNPCIKIPATRMHKLRTDIRRVLRDGHVQARILARIAGQCVAMTKVIVPSKLLLRNVYRLLSKRNSWQDSLQLDVQTIGDLEWWLDAIVGWNGRPVTIKPIDAQIICDASSQGWGAIFEGKEAAGFWNRRLSRSHTNYRELMAILMTLETFKDSIKNKHVQILSDNVTAVAMVNHLGGQCWSLTQVAQAIWSLAYENNIMVTAKYIEGVFNTSDSLSRIKYSPYSWKLHPAIFRMLDRIWGNHTIDRFADMINHQVPVYNSLYLDPLTSGVDALAQTNWKVHNNYVNAPFFLIPKILNVIITQKAWATVIAPMWPAQPWFNVLKRLAVTLPLRLPNSQRLFCHPNQIPEPRKNRKWKLYAWRIYGGNA